MALSEYGPAAVTRGYNTYEERLKRDKAKGRRDVWMRGVLPTIGFAAGGAALGAAGAGGGVSLPAGATAGMLPPSTAGTAGGAMGLGRLWDVANLGIGSAASIYGQRSNNRAIDRQMALTREQMAMQAAADAEARAEAKRQFDAQQANEARRFAADDEERAFSRGLIEQREARRAPYRQASRAALSRLGDFLGVRF